MSNKYYDFYIWNITLDEIEILKAYILLLNTQVFLRKDVIKLVSSEINKEKTCTECTIIGYKISVCGYNDKQIIDSFLKAFNKGIYINFYCVKRGEK